MLIEASVNAIRISIKIKQKDDMEHILVKKMTGFLMQRAENFFILRRKPVEVQYNWEATVRSMPAFHASCFP